MKILHVITTMNPSSGGPSQGIRLSDAELRKSSSVKREVVSLDDPEADFLGKDDFVIHALGAGKGVWWYNEKLIPWLVLNIPRFEVVIINGLWLFSTYAVWKAMRILKKKAAKSQDKVPLPKMFVMPHGMLDPYFQKTPERRFKAIRNLVYWHLIEHRVINDAFGLLFTCETELELARTTFGNYHPKRELNVSYGVSNPPPFSLSMKKAFNERCHELGNSPYLLFISRIHEKKGVDLLINVYLKIAQEIADSDQLLPKLVIAGPGLETPFGRAIRKQVISDKILKRSVFFTGMLSGDAKWGAFYGSDAFVLPSHQENFGIAVAEALSCGKPVLITDKINIWKEIQNGGGGMISTDTSEGIYLMLKKWLNLDQQKRSEMELKAVNIFKNHFAITEASNRFLEALKTD